jgi:biopolymer transport protein ExbB/TolQ
MPRPFLQSLISGEAHPTGLGPSRWLLAAAASGIAVSLLYALIAGSYASGRAEQIDSAFKKATPILGDAVTQTLLGDYPLVVKGDQGRFAPFDVIEINDAGRALANAAEDRVRESRKRNKAPGPAQSEAAMPSALAATKVPPITAEQEAELKDVAADAAPGLAAKFFGYEQLAMYMMAALAIFLLASQMAEVRRQREQLEIDAALFGEARVIKPEDAGLLSTRLQQGGARTGTGRFVVTQLLRRFERTGEIDSAAAAGEAAIETVDAELVARLNVVRFAIWAIPTVGFIGTVRGIGGALALASSPERLPAVVGFLGVAFDTTMVGLILCLSVVLLSHELERRTDRFLDELSSGAVAAIQRRLRHGGTSTGRQA